MPATAKTVEQGFVGSREIFTMGKTRLMREYRFFVDGCLISGRADSDVAEFFVMHQRACVRPHGDIQFPHDMAYLCELEARAGRAHEVCYVQTTDAQHPELDLDWLHEAAAAEINQNIGEVIAEYPSARWDSNFGAEFLA